MCSQVSVLGALQARTVTISQNRVHTRALNTILRSWGYVVARQQNTTFSFKGVRLFMNHCIVGVAFNITFTHQGEHELKQENLQDLPWFSGVSIQCDCISWLFVKNWSVYLLLKVDIPFACIAVFLRKRRCNLLTARYLIHLYIWEDLLLITVTLSEFFGY